MKESKVANVLINLRKQHGYTQSDLAEKLGVSFQAVSKWERGENLPDAFTLVELADIYSITVDEILHGKVNIKELSPNKHKRKTIILGIAVAMIIIAPASIFVLGYDNWNLYIPIILVVTAISVLLMIYSTMSEERLKNYSNVTREQKRKEEIIYAICTGVFMVLGLGFQLFHIAWVVFIFGYAATLIVKK
ncbi:HTH-type transcriptional regulator ImmR [Candidatus Izimaplasma bacterium HR1]|jgi:transcriptional regulator with XRE-family HTH domain|uniref:helix-turn-helix domain-containing protein n=1 Tax=Candidatus Izimoplasma sp. HR1 TaxID=1541959 RepID=UPI0004F74843|nr:HTH-type transcriptional regulator ImmR [Candidatus Izimaplasma bacterium HR1]